MKIFKTQQVKEIDDYTIKNEPIDSIDLMERASVTFVKWFMRQFDSSRKVYIFAGPGNNGGDGLAIARLLDKRFFDVEAVLLKFGKGFSDDLKINKDRLDRTGVKLSVVENENDFQELEPGNIIIDAIFGSGLSRKAEGLPALAIQKINDAGCDVVSVDIPSGLFGEDNTDNDPGLIVKADYTISFEFPFLSFFFPENENFTGEWKALSIGLHPEAIRKTPSDYHFLDREDVKPLIKKRSKFAHKGTHGNVLLIAGHDGMMGAAVLGIEACLRTGSGLATAHVPGKSYPIIQNTVPEALISIDNSDTHFSSVPGLEAYSAIAAGPGLNKKEDTARALEELLKKARVPLLLDADALNIISEKPGLMDLLPEDSVLTPHPREFDRLFGNSENMYQRHNKQLDASRKYKVFIILKGAYTMISDKEGHTWINSTGNPGMASGGSGDVLTGMVVSLLGQGYSPGEASILGVYLHGLAGDLALEEQSQESLIPGDITAKIGKAFKLVRSDTKN